MIPNCGLERKTLQPPPFQKALNPSFLYIDLATSNKLKFIKFCLINVCIRVLITSAGVHANAAGAPANSPATNGFNSCFSFRYQYNGK